MYHDYQTRASSNNIRMPRIDCRIWLHPVPLFILHTVYVATCLLSSLLLTDLLLLPIKKMLLSWLFEQGRDASESLLRSAYRF